MDFREWYLWDPNRLGLKLANRGIETFAVKCGYTKFLNIVKKNGAELTPMGEIRKKWKEDDTSYFWIRGYCVPQEIFFQSMDTFLKERGEILTKFNELPDIFKLNALLKFIFNKNQAAHACSVRGAGRNAFDKKSKYLKIAVELAKTITLPFFSCGFQEDVSTPYHPYILYFQMGAEQVSFHSDECFKMDDFTGKWIGHNQTRYPITVLKISRLLNDLHLKESELSRKYTFNVNEFNKESIHSVDNLYTRKEFEQYVYHRTREDNGEVPTWSNPFNYVLEDNDPKPPKESTPRTLDEFIKK